MIRAMAMAVMLGVLGASDFAAAQPARRRMAPIPIGNVGEWFPADDYPADAIRGQRSGRTIVELGVDSGGKVVSCKLAQTSGTTSLDDKTCELAMLRGRFDPATDRRGRPIAGVYRLPVHWFLPVDAGELGATDIAQAAKLELDFEFTIGADGRIEACRMTGPRQDGVPDLCRQRPVGSSWGHRYTNGGEPVRAIVRGRSSQTVTAAAGLP